MSRFLVFLLLATVALSGADSPPLLVAVRSGDHATVQKLLASGADPNSTDADGTTALMHATLESDARMMTVLLDRGAGRRNGLPWSDRELAAALKGQGISQITAQAIRAWRVGRARQPRGGALLALARVLGCRPESLLE